MSTVLLIPLGVGEAFTARYYTSCLVLGVDDTWLMIDCPHPVRKMLHEASTDAALASPLDLDRIHAVAVSHLHADHCCGLEDFGYFSLFALGRRAKLLMHPDASARLWDGLLAAGMELVQTKPDEPPVRKQLDDYFQLIDLRPLAAGQMRAVLSRVPADDPQCADFCFPHHGRRPRARLQCRHGLRPDPDRVA